VILAFTGTRRGTTAVQRAAWPYNKGFLELVDCLEALRKLPEKFARFIYAPINDEDCWIWAASLSGGYGQVRFNGKTQKAHIVIYTICVGSIPEGLE
jgi:hypothetical protein